MVKVNDHGFTEEDQANIAEEVQGRAHIRRTGLGFGGAASSDVPAPARGDGAAAKSTSSSAWFHQAQASSAVDFASTKNDHDTTKGAFPWDGGQRGTSAGARKTGSSTARMDTDAPGDGPARERAFPLIRDRDIERSKESGRSRRSRSRSKSRSRSRSRGRQRRKSDRDARGRGNDRNGYRGQRRSRSRSRSRDHDRRLFRDRHGRSDRDRDVARDGSRDRYRGRDSGRSHRRDLNDRTRQARSRETDRKAHDVDRRHSSPNRNSRDGQRKFSVGDDKRSLHAFKGRETGGDDGTKRIVDRKATPEEKATKLTAGEAKTMMKVRLRKVAAQDSTLKTGFTATVGGGAGWERPEMSAAADFFKSDEVASKGGVASVAPEYKARLAEILAVEDEDTMCLGESVRKVPKTDTSGAVPAAFDRSTKAHHDAIFAPTASADMNAEAPVASVQSPPPATPMTGARMIVGANAAARARLALSGKLSEAAADKTKATLSKPKAQRRDTSERQKAPAEDADEQPLFKTLRVGDAVEARYTDDKWYKAAVLQVIHGGFEIARYKVRYTEYGNEETLSWRRIRRLDVGGTDAIAPARPAPEKPVPPPEPALPNAQEPEAAGKKVSQAFAGMRPRSLCVDSKDPPTKAEAKAEEHDESAPPAPAAVVVNKSITSAASGKKTSWRDKLQARKAGAVGHLRPVDKTDDSMLSLSKDVSLVPDFAAHRKKHQENKLMDKSEWRAKVVFGIGGTKTGDR